MLQVYIALKKKLIELDKYSAVKINKNAEPVIQLICLEVAGLNAKRSLVKLL